MPKHFASPQAREDAFQAWKAQVNTFVVTLCGLGCDDLPDFCYWDAWDEGRKPLSVARDVVREAGSY